MQTLTVADFALRLAVGVGCGAIIGLERQWRARMAGLRTNALVATGATLFVLYAVATEDSSPTRVASYVVSGIGFLGGGVILRGGVQRPRSEHGCHALVLGRGRSAGRLRASGVHPDWHRNHRRCPSPGAPTWPAGRPRQRRRRRRAAALPGTGDLSAQSRDLCTCPYRAAHQQQRHHAAGYTHGAGRRRQHHVDGPPIDGWPYPGQARAVGGGTVAAAGRLRCALVCR